MYDTMREYLLDLEIDIANSNIGNSWTTTEYEIREYKPMFKKNKIGGEVLVAGLNSEPKNREEK